MQLKDANIGSRVFIHLTRQDYSFPERSDFECDVVGIVIAHEHDPYQTRVAFRKDERVTSNPTQLLHHPDDYLYPAYDKVECIRRETHCQPAYNRRFLR